MRARIIAVVVAAVLAVAGAIALVLAFRAAEQASVAGERLVDVLVVRAEIPAGTRGDQLGDRVALEQLPARYVVPGAVSDRAALAGLVAAVDLEPGEQVLASRFGSPEQLASSGVHVAVPEGLQEVSVAVDLQRIAGGSVGPGDRVGVFASFGTGPSNGTTRLVLDGVLVTSVASTVSQDAAGTQAQGLVLVTLAVSAEDAATVVHAAEFGRIWMTAQNETTAHGDASVAADPGPETDAGADADDDAEDAS